MGRYAQEPENPSKTAKAKGSNLRVHFKVSWQLQLIRFKTAFFVRLARCSKFLPLYRQPCYERRGDTPERRGSMINYWSLKAELCDIGSYRKPPRPTKNRCVLRFHRTLVRRLKPSRRCPWTELSSTWRTSSNTRKSSPSAGSWEASADTLRYVFKIQSWHFLSCGRTHQAFFTDSF